jgi:hypothetical protein
MLQSLNNCRCTWQKQGKYVTKGCVDSHTGGECPNDLRTCSNGVTQMTLQRLPTYGCLFSVCPYGFSVVPTPTGIGGGTSCFKKYKRNKRMCKADPECRWKQQKCANANANVGPPPAPEPEPEPVPTNTCATFTCRPVTRGATFRSAFQYSGAPCSANTTRSVCSAAGT